MIMHSEGEIENSKIIELYNGRIIDVKNGCLFLKNTIIQICDGKIIIICNKEQSKPTANYSINMQEKYIMPGMINSHAHIHIVMPGVLVNMKDMKRAQQFTQKQIEKGLEDCLEYGITVVRDALSDKLKELNQLKQQIEKGKLKGPKIYNSIHIAPLGGTYAPKYSFAQQNIMKLFNHTPPDYMSSDVGIVTTPANATEYEIKQAVEIATKRGADFIKFCDQEEKMLTYKPGALNFNEQQLHTAIDECKKYNLKTNIHHIAIDTFRKSLKCGISSLAHLPLDEKLTEIDLAMFKESEAMIEPTLTVAYNYCWTFKGNEYNNHENMEEIANIQSLTYKSIAEKYWIDEMQEIVVTHFEKAQQQKFKTMWFMDMSKVYKLMSGYISFGMRNMQLLLENGLHDRISFGNDSGASQCSPATKDSEIDVYRFCAQKCGFNSQEINKQLVQMFTINGAKLMGINDKYGSVEEAKQADFAIFSDNPLDNSDVLKNKVDALIMDGKLKINNCDLKIENQ